MVTLSKANVLWALAFLARNNSSWAFQPTTSSSSFLSRTSGINSKDSLLELNVATSLQQPTTSTSTTGTTKDRAVSACDLRTYVHDGYTLKYRYKAATPGKENEPPLLLIHPVGIGMSSWFWENFIAEWKGGPVYAPDLIGCGIDNGSDAWKPEEKGMFFPLSWVRGCETLLEKVIYKNNPLSSLFSSNNKKVTVVTQGGLAPVGVMLASRNPDTVQNLIMSSPPTWKEMTTAVPEAELAKNYDALTSPILGKVAFGALESSWAIRFFSNLFLFENKADDEWMSYCLDECLHGEEARPPIQAFNAGLMQHRSYLDELTSLPQSTFIVQGKADVNRIPQQPEYATQMKDCTLVTLPAGLNVLPWECPAVFAETVQQAQQQPSKK